MENRRLRNLFRYLIGVPAALLILLSYSYAPASAGFSPDLESKVRRHTLANGMRILIVERPMSPTVSLYIRHRAGAVQEIPGKTGAAHLLEHMLFKGTETIGSRNFAAESELLEKISETGKALDRERKKGDRADVTVVRELETRLDSLQKKADALTVRSEVDRLYSENGAVHQNAGTGQDLTTYYVSLPANRIELWARIESERMLNPVFREFYSERKVVREERRQSVESSPGRILMERFQAAAFRVHPYGRPVIGLPDDIDALSVDDLRDFFKSFYAPENTVVAVVGAVSGGAVLSMIETYFGRIPRGSRQPVLSIPAEPAQSGERRIQVALDANPEILIGYHKPTLPARDDYVFDLIDALLSKGRTSRLYQALVQRIGVAQAIDTSSGFPGSLYPNLFLIHGKPRAPHTAGELEAGIYAEIEALKNIPVPPAELEKVKNQIRMDFLRDLTSNSGIAGKLSYYETAAGDYRYITRHLAILETISPEEIMQTARRYFTPENRTVAVLTKGPGK